MKKGRAAVATAMLLGFQSISALASGSFVFPPNPVGEALYRQQLNRELPLPIGVIVFAFLAGWIVHKFRHQRKTDLPHDPTRPIEQGSAPPDSDPPACPADSSDMLFKWARPPWFATG
jgi:hypothetical protein